MRIDLNWKQEFAIILIVAVVAGGLWGGLWAYSYEKSPLLNMLSQNLLVSKDQSISAESFSDLSGRSYVFPPPLYVLESLEYQIQVENVTGGWLEVNLTRDGTVLRTESILVSSRILISGYEEFRSQVSNVDVVFTSKGYDTNVQWVYVQVTHWVRSYNPLIYSLSLMAAVALMATPVMYRRRMRSQRIVPTQALQG